MSVFGFLAASVALVSIFQNCSKVGFESTADQTKALTVVATPCIDASKQSHDSGSTWQTTSTSTKTIVCADSNSLSQGYSDTTAYLCQDGVITVAGSSSQLVPPTASVPAPVLNASLSPSNPQPGGSSQLLVATQAVHNVQYTCKSVANGSTFSAGSLAVGSASVGLANIVEDLSCQVSAASASAPLTQTLNLNLDCESSGLLKDPTTHTCVAFKCQTYTALAPRSDGVYQVPARTSAGICYSVKLMSAIANSASSLSTSKDNDVISRNHSEWR